MDTLLVTGAGSLVGGYLQELIDPQGSVVLVSRHQPASLRPHFKWQASDLAREKLSGLQAEAVMHLAPLPLLPRHIPSLAAAGIKRLVAVGTTSRFTKAESSSALDKKTVGEQTRAETELVKLCDAHRIAWTLFRPTMVYDGHSDKNISVISRTIERWGYFPVIGDARGLRQPLHAQDLAAACLTVLESPATHGKAYNLAGGERLTYREMVERIFAAHGKRAQLVHVPLWVFRAGLWCAAMHPRYHYLTPAMANRMNQDMVFDISAAQRDFGFSPRAFQPEFEDR